MTLPINTDSILRFLYPSEDPLATWSLLADVDNVTPLLTWIGTPPAPTEQEIIDAGNDLTMVNGQTYSQWLVEHGGDPIATLRRAGRDAIDANNDRWVRLIRGMVIETVDQLNLLREIPFAGIYVANNPSNSQPITPDTWTTISEFAGAQGGNGKSANGATADKDNNQIILGKAMPYRLSLSLTYAVTGGNNNDFEFALFAITVAQPLGVELTDFRARRESDAGNAASLTIGPLVRDTNEANVKIELRCRHSETGTRNLIVGDAQLYAEGRPDLAQITYPQARTAIKSHLDTEN